MSRQAKIIIFSIILAFSWYYKNFSSDKSKSSDSTEIIKPDAAIEPLVNNNDFLEESKNKKSNENSDIINYSRPKNGFSPYDAYFGKGIYNNNTGNSFLIKNSNQTDAVVLLVNAYTGRKVRNEFVRKGSNFEMTGVPNGTYYLEWFSGNNWSPNLLIASKYKGGFQTQSSFTKTKDLNDYMKVEGYQQWTVTLYSVTGGDVESEGINADEFFN